MGCLYTPGLTMDSGSTQRGTVVNTIEEQVLLHLDRTGAVKVDSHFVLTGGPDGLPRPDGGGMHATSYCNIRRLGHGHEWIKRPEHAKYPVAA